MVFSLFPRKSASVLLFRETVQTQYLNKIRGAQKSVIPSKHFSIVRFRLAASRRSFFFPKLLCQFVVGRRRLCRHRFASKIPSNAQTPRKIRVTETAQKVHGRAREVRHADRTRTDVRGPQAPGAGGRGVGSTKTVEASAALCVCGRAGCWEGKARVSPAIFFCQNRDMYLFSVKTATCTWTPIGGGGQREQLRIWA